MFFKTFLRKVLSLKRKKSVKSRFICSLRLADKMFPFIFIAPVAEYFKTASNFIIALHVVTAVKEFKMSERKKWIACQLNRRFNDSTVS